MVYHNSVNFKLKYLKNYKRYKSFKHSSEISEAWGLRHMYQIYIEIKLNFHQFSQRLHIFKFKLWPLKIFKKKSSRSKNFLMFVDHNHQIWGSNYQNCRILWYLNSGSTAVGFRSDPSSAGDYSMSIAKISRYIYQ